MVKRTETRIQESIQEEEDLSAEEIELPGNVKQLKKGLERLKRLEGAHLLSYVYRYEDKDNSNSRKWQVGRYDGGNVDSHDIGTMYGGPALYCVITRWRFDDTEAPEGIAKSGELMHPLVRIGVDYGDPALRVKDISRGGGGVEISNPQHQLGASVSLLREMAAIVKDLHPQRAAGPADSFDPSSLASMFAKAMKTMLESQVGMIERLGNGNGQLVPVAGNANPSDLDLAGILKMLMGVLGQGNQGQGQKALGEIVAQLFAAFQKPAGAA